LLLDNNLRLFSRYWGHDLDFSESLHVIGNGTIQFSIDRFLFASSDSFSATHRLATIHTLQTTTDGRNTVA